MLGFVAHRNKSPVSCHCHCDFGNFWKNNYSSCQFLSKTLLNSSQPRMTSGQGDAPEVDIAEHMELEHRMSASTMLGCTLGPGAVDISPEHNGRLWKEVLYLPEGDREEMGVHYGMEVKVHYTGRLTDGVVFDESDRNATPFSFTIGEGAVITAWEIGVLKMKRGEVHRLTCHPDVAYKNRAQGKIPANSTLIFDIEVVDYAPEDLTKNKSKKLLRYVVKQGETKYLNPNHGSEIQIALSGTYKKIVVFENRVVKFNLGEGCEVGIPYGVEKALYKFRIGEAAVLIISGLKYGLPASEYDKHGLPYDTPLEFSVELMSNENTKEPWQLDGAEKLVSARKLKEIGNRFFNQGNYRVAFKNYKLIVDHLKAEALLVGEEEEERKKLLLASYLNQAICNLKLGKPTLVIRNCDDALDLDKNSTKALYRRGQASLSVNLPDAAKQDFERMLHLEPDNPSGTHQLTLCEKKIKENMMKEKQLYSKMFSTAEKPNKSAGVPSGMDSVNEWAKTESNGTSS